MIDKTMVSVMEACNNFFAVLYERVSGAIVASKAITAKFEGKYTTGMIVRVHGAYRASYAANYDYGAGECYEVESFDGETLTLDHALHTLAPNLLIVVCEPTGAFMDVCSRIAAGEEADMKRRGLSSESIGGYSWSAGSNGAGILANYGDMLKQWRMPAPTRLFYARGAVRWR